MMPEKVWLELRELSGHLDGGCDTPEQCLPFIAPTLAADLALVADIRLAADDFGHPITEKSTYLAGARRVNLIQDEDYPVTWYSEGKAEGCGAAGTWEQWVELAHQIICRDLAIAAKEAEREG